MHFLSQKIDFFKILQTFRGWFLSVLDGLRGVLSTLKLFYHTTHWFWEKSIFWLKKCVFYPLTAEAKKCHFLVKKSIFLKISVWCDKTVLRWMEPGQTFYSPFLSIWEFLEIHSKNFALSFILGAEDDLNHFEQCFVQIVCLWESQSCNWCKWSFLMDSVNIGYMWYPGY